MEAVGFSEISTRVYDVTSRKAVLSLMRRNFFEDQGFDGRVILKWGLTKYGLKSVRWINLAHNRGLWCALVNVVKLQALWKVCNCLRS
jgi:hypothetical protein